MSEEGETPGWDIEYPTDNGEKNAIEVKGTQRSAFPSIELTKNEWQSAEKLRDHYSLFLVSKCLDTHPVIEVIRDPFKLFTEGELSVIPLAWRVERIGE